MISSVLVFLVSSVVIAVFGSRLARHADMLADATRLGEAVVGTVLLGAVTSMAGSLTSVTASLDGHPQLALGNALGGIAAQTFFLVLADIAYRRANLEHAAASLENIISGMMLITLLCLVLIAGNLPATTMFGVHPMSPLLIGLYVLGVRLSSQTRRHPPWMPDQTEETRLDVTDPARADEAPAIWPVLRAIGLSSVCVAVAGVAVARSGLDIAQRTGVDEGLVGLLLTAVVTSAPELVTTIAAVRRRALTLAIGGILGGNTFDVLFVAFSDMAYRPGSVYHEMGDDMTFASLLCVVMTAVLLLGMLTRERYGPGNIGWEGVTLTFLYTGGMCAMALLF